MSNGAGALVSAADWLSAPDPSGMDPSVVDHSSAFPTLHTGFGNVDNLLNSYLQYSAWKKQNGWQQAAHDQAAHLQAVQTLQNNNARLGYATDPRTGAPVKAGFLSSMSGSTVLIIAGVVAVALALYVNK